MIFFRGKYRVGVKVVSWEVTHGVGWTVGGRGGGRTGGSGGERPLDGE
jgi:hypothetical protein